MRFTEVWGDTLKQNKFLKLLVLFFGFILSVEAIICWKLSERAPLIVERGCFSKVVDLPKAVQVTPIEMESFITEAISYRFNSDINPVADFFSTEEMENRTHEQEEFIKKGISQIVVVHPRSIKVDGNKVRFEAERIIMVQNLRSTLPFILEATISVVGRSPNNPYGVKIEELKEVKDVKKEVSN